MRKVTAHVVPVAVSTTLTVMAGALMPPTAAWALLLTGPAIAIALCLVLVVVVVALVLRGPGAAGARHAASRPERHRFRKDEGSKPAPRRAAIIINPTKFDSVPATRAELTAAKTAPLGVLRRPVTPQQGCIAAGNNGVYRVRSDGRMYSGNDSPRIPELTLNWNARPTSTVYSRVTVGLLENMYGGVSAEVLWKPVGQNWGLGAELARQSAALGHDLALCARRTDRLDELATEITASNPSVTVRTYALDVTDARRTRSRTSSTPIESFSVRTSVTSG